MSLLVWSEHCVECAAPACYTSCDLYDRRPDGRCRRFAFGIYRNHNFKSVRGYGAEIAFKKWAKLEARGNTRLHRTSTLLKVEKGIEYLSVVTGFVGRLIGRVTRNPKWLYLPHVLQERLARYLHRSSTCRPEPTAFLTEVYNTGSSACTLQLTMNLSKEASAGGRVKSDSVPPFHVSVECQPGYSRHEFPRSSFDPITRLRLPFDIALTPDDEASVRLVLLSADFVTFSGAQESVGQREADIKCVVWDLDNTMWDGTLVEGDAVQFREPIREVLQALDKRGILCSIASKNDYATALQKLTQLGIADYFVYPQINWNPKSQSLKRLGEKLNISVDTFAFVDDNPFELAEVGQALPQVLCVPADEVGSLLQHRRMAGSTTEDAAHRRTFYQVAMLREEKQAEYKDDYLGFLASCDIVLEIVRYSEADETRVAELVQRTNQLNFSGAKYRREDLESILSDPATEKLVMRCSDRFGSYGTIGFSVISRTGDEVYVREFMLSCRVQGKRIEQAFFNYLVHSDLAGPASRVRIAFRQTARNSPAREVLAGLGFCSVADGNCMAIDVKDASFACPFIRVTASPAAR
jgi:FkbH-like protein